jgi:electron transfer flavoprotein alpha subunit
VANVVVFVEVREGKATTASRFAVAEARRVGSDLGATVYAVVAIAPLPDQAIEALAASIGEAGADRVLCCMDDALAGAAVDVFVGPLLASLAERLAPLLTIFPAGAVGPALGPPLAVRLGGPYHPRASLEVLRPAGEPPRLELRRFRAADSAIRALELGTMDRPVVTTLGVGPDPGRRGTPLDEVEMVAYTAPARPGVRELDVEPEAQDPQGDRIELAALLVVVDRTVAEERLDQLRAAAAPGTVVLQAAPGQRNSAVALASPERVLVVGQGPASAALVRGTLTPQTRVAVVGSKSAEKGLGRIDVVWRADRDKAVTALVSALAPDGEAQREPGQEPEEAVP